MTKEALSSSSPTSPVEVEKTSDTVITSSPQKSSIVNQDEPTLKLEGSPSNSSSVKDEVTALKVEESSDGIEKSMDVPEPLSGKSEESSDEEAITVAKVAERLRFFFF